MYYAEDRIYRILKWAEDHPNFDTEFVENMADVLSEYGELTEAQEEALDNIIQGFQIP